MAAPADPHGVIASQNLFEAERQKALAKKAEIEKLKKEIEDDAKFAKKMADLVDNIAAAPGPPPPIPGPAPPYISNKNAQDAKEAILAAKKVVEKKQQLDNKVQEMETAVQAMAQAQTQNEATKAAALKSTWVGKVPLLPSIIKKAVDLMPDKAPGPLAACTAVKDSTTQKARELLQDMKDIKTALDAPGGPVAQAAAAKQQAADRRVNQLRWEGHGPQRHLDPTPTDLGNRALYKIDPEGKTQREFKGAAWDKHVANATASKVNLAEDYVLAEAAAREAFLKAACPGGGAPPPVPLPGGSRVPIATAIPGKAANAAVMGIVDANQNPAKVWAKMDPAQNSKQVVQVPLLPAPPPPPPPPNYPPATGPSPGAAGSLVPMAAQMDQAQMAIEVAANTINGDFTGGDFQAFYDFVPAAPPAVSPCTDDAKLKTMWPEPLVNPIAKVIPPSPAANPTDVKIPSYGGKGPFTWTKVNGDPAINVANNGAGAASSTGKVTAAGGALPAGDHTVRVQVTDSSVPPVSKEMDITIKLT